MSRWFRHYAGMARDDKLVRVSIRSNQSVERVVWYWTAVLESASEIDDGGRYEVDHAEMARFLRCPASKLVLIEDALRDLGRISECHVAKWRDRQFQSDRSAERTKRYRDRHKGNDDTRMGTSRDADVTSQERRGDAPETETETETEYSVANATADSDKAFWSNAKAYLGASKASHIGKWVKQHGKDRTAAAIAQAQVDRAVDPPSYIEGVLRKPALSVVNGGWVSPC